MSPISRRFAGRVKLLRQRKNWTQAQLGRAAGLTFKFIGEIERAEASPTLTSLEKLARALNVTVGDLLSFEKRAKGKTKGDIFLQLSQRDLVTVRKALNVLNRVFR